MNALLTDDEAKQKANVPEPLTYDVELLKVFVKEAKACIGDFPE